MNASGIVRIVDEPEVKFLQSGSSLCTFRFMFRAGRGKEPGSLFWSGTIWGKRGETFAQYMHKGSSVLISGAIEVDRWTGKDGEKRERIKLNVSDFEFVGPPKKSSDSKPRSEDEPEHEMPPDPDYIPSGDEIPF